MKKDIVKTEIQRRDTNQKLISGKGTQTPKPTTDKNRNEELLFEFSQYDKEKIASGVEYSLVNNAIRLILVPFYNLIALCASIIPQFIWLLLELIVGCVYLSGYKTIDKTGR